VTKLTPEKTKLFGIDDEPLVDIMFYSLEDLASSIIYIAQLNY
jgi:hypothetical protein